MEDTLRDNRLSYCCHLCNSLNPCFNGRYSQRLTTMKKKQGKAVLILVLMEDTLRGINVSAMNYLEQS